MQKAKSMGVWIKMKIDANRLQAAIIENRPRHHIMTNKALADRLGVSDKTISNRLKNPESMKIWDATELFRVCKLTDEQIAHVLTLGGR